MAATAAFWTSMKSLFRHYWNMCNYMGKLILINGVKRIKNLPQGILLDVGCGEMPYKKYFSRNITNYIGLDRYIIDPHSKEFCGKEVDVVADAICLPIQCRSIDTILCFNSLNVFRNPFMFFQEANRVLNAQGLLIITTGFMYQIWSDIYDRWRVTNYGLRLMAEDNGFVVNKILPLGEGFWTTTVISLREYMLLMLSDGIKLFLKGSNESYYIRFKKIISTMVVVFFTPILPILINLLFIISWILDELLPSNKHTVYYLLIARKK